MIKNIYTITLFFHVFTTNRHQSATSREKAIDFTLALQPVPTQ